VVPKEVVQWEGEKSLYGLIDKARKDKERVMAETSAKPAALPAIPGPSTFHSPDVARRQALPA
jgi:hypothetical protein